MTIVQTIPIVISSFALLLSLYTYIRHDAKIKKQNALINHFQLKFEEMNNQNRSFFFNVDWLTIILFLCLLTIGWLNINAAVYQEGQSFINFTSNSGKQLLFIIVAISTGVVILLLDSKFFYTFSPIFYGITILLLMAVLVVGRNVGGNQAWIPIGSFRLQP